MWLRCLYRQARNNKLYPAVIQCKRRRLTFSYGVSSSRWQHCAAMKALPVRQIEHPFDDNDGMNFGKTNYHWKALFRRVCWMVVGIILLVSRQKFCSGMAIMTIFTRGEWRGLFIALLGIYTSIPVQFVWFSWPNRCETISLYRLRCWSTQTHARARTMRAFIVVVVLLSSDGSHTRSVT